MGVIRLASSLQYTSCFGSPVVSQSMSKPSNRPEVDDGAEQGCVEHAKSTKSSGRAHIKERGRNEEY